MPLQMRLPKRGFNSPNRKEYEVFNLTRLQEISEKHGLTTISPEALYKAKLIKKNDLVKILGTGEVSTALTITAHAASASAQEAIQKAGGSVTTG